MEFIKWVKEQLKKMQEQEKDQRYWKHKTGKDYYLFDASNALSAYGNYEKKYC